MSAPSTTAPRVTCIIPAFNAAKYLERAFNSIQAQSFRDFELFIVDDGSRDNTFQLALDLARRDPERTRVLQHPGAANRGVAAARNLALSEARGMYVAFLDADDTWHVDKLERQVAFMDQHAKVGTSITQAKIIREGDGHRFIPGQDILGGDPPEDLKTALFHILTIQLNYIFSTVMMRTAWVRDAGCFVEDLPFQSEDRLLVSMLAAFHPIRLIPEVLCDYYAHGESYTAGVLSGGFAAPIFFDMQVRYTRWLARQPGRRKWARELATYVLPHTFLAAFTVARQQPRYRRNVLGHFCYMVARYPRTVFILLLHAAHRLTGVSSFTGKPPRPN